MTEQQIRDEKLHMDGKSRNVSFELLRIIAMCMIIALHYLSKGDVLVPLASADGMTGAAVMAWVIEALCLPAVNVYVLISGYFGVKSRFRLAKIANLWGVAVFYSVAITLLLGVTGNLSSAQGTLTFTDLTIYDWMNVVFPVVTEEYWFITAYVILYVLMPFLNAGIEKLERKDYRNILLVLFVIFSVSKSVLPMQLPIDKKGYDVLWFVCLYLLGGYFGKYGCRIFEKRYRTLLCYVIPALGVFVLAFAARYLYLQKGMLADFVLTNYFYTYNHVLCLLASVGLFGLFTQLRLDGERTGNVLCRIASCTVAVYIIHEQIYMRYLWPEWFGCASYAGKWAFIPHMLVTVVCVFAGGTLIEVLRKNVLECIKKRRMKND